MRRLLLIVALFAVAGCGSDEPVSPTPASDDGPFPATVEHKFGTTQPYAVWPWAQDELGDARPTVLDASDGFQFERIAALRPDLILGVNSGMKKADCDKLSQLAPTVAAGKGSTEYFSPWDEQVELVAAALGKPEEGRDLVQGIRDDFAAAAEAHPEFAGKTATFAQNGFYDGLLYVYPEGLGPTSSTCSGSPSTPSSRRWSSGRASRSASPPSASG